GTKTGAARPSPETPPRKRTLVRATPPLSATPARRPASGRRRRRWQRTSTPAGPCDEDRRRDARPQSSFGLPWPGRDPARHPDQLGERARAHLPHGAAAMDLDRDLRRSELRGDLLVEHPRNDEGHHLALTRRQGGVTVLERPQLDLLPAGDLVALE